MTAQNERDSVMKNLLLAAAAATMVIAASPVFANPASEAEEGFGVYPSVGSCHFVKEAVTAPNGRVVYQTVQVCN
jgi:hypothetical protein